MAGTPILTYWKCLTFPVVDGKLQSRVECCALPGTLEIEALQIQPLPFSLRTFAGRINYDLTAERYPDELFIFDNMRKGQDH